jgi:uncharacterized protein (DUF4415 family)
MAKKSSASSRRGRLKSATSEDIAHKRWTKAELAQVRRLAELQAAGDDSHIDTSDIPPLSPAFLSRMTRFRDRHAKIPVSVRLDPQVLAWLKSKGSGHLTRINDILANLMEAERAAR